MSNDTETPWGELAERWRGAESAPRSAAEEVASFVPILRRRRTLTGLVVLGEGLVTAALAWVTLTVIRRTPTVADVVFLTGLWVIWVIATGFAWWNRRGQWGRSAADTTQFVSLSLEYARRKVRVARFSVGLLLAQLLMGVVAWVGGAGLMRDGFSSLAALMGWLGPLSLAYLTWIVWYHRRAAAEVRHFRDLLDELES